MAKKRRPVDAAALRRREDIANLTTSTARNRALSRATRVANGKKGGRRKLHRGSK